MDRTFRAFRSFTNGFNEWYADSRFRQVRSWGLLGLILGAIYAKALRHYQLVTAEFGDHYVLTEYSLSKRNVTEFETLWNRQARLTQRFDGYVGTKLLKALNRDWPKEDENNTEGFSTGPDVQAGAENSAVQAESEGSKEMTEAKQPAVPLTMAVEPPNRTDTPTIADPANRLPFQYLQIRAWKSPAAEKVWMEDEKIREIGTQMEKTCTKVQKYEFGTIINDQVSRLVA